ncbi:F-box protein CPR1-like [Mercurialis annua]|uniref:F-box protein CPR1-like n=1 Tax=Mercurialis annua TaxID=3986 RepID=UPI00216049F2|nr:F-box protein CPR1-like [Mercurialis annua]
MSAIPFDNASDILKHLPVKSLLRFRCLSKAYCSLIDSRDFTNLHLSQSKSTNTNRFLFIAQTDLQQVNNKTYIMNLDSPDYQHVEFDHPFSVSSESSLGDKTDSYHLDHLKNVVIFGSCNGLIALYHPVQGMLLWNPSTKKQQKLPNFWGPDHKIHSSDHLLDGFGYDPVSDDYKLIRIRTANDEREKRSRAMVYSVKHNCSRRMEDFPYDVHQSRNWGTLVGSCLHWIVYEPDDYVYDHDKLIVAFNLEDERFGRVPIPDVLKSEDHCLIELGEVGGCLSMCTDVNDDMSVEIWVMKEYGIRESWIKIFSEFRGKVGMSFYWLPSHVKPIGYSKKGDRLLFDVHSCLLVGYDLREEEENQTSECQPRKRIHRIGNLGDDGEIKWNYALKCVTSLVPLNFNAN